uniref:Uncharacterized protein n=1 Tax=Solanum tuberosum TaxID=4113 RepID=M1C3N9_SOLTU
MKLCNLNLLFNFKKKKLYNLNLLFHFKKMKRQLLIPRKVKCEIWVSSRSILRRWSYCFGSSLSTIPILQKLTLGLLFLLFLFYKN